MKKQQNKITLSVKLNDTLIIQSSVDQTDMPILEDVDPSSITIDEAINIICLLGATYQTVKKSYSMKIKEAQSTKE